MTDSSAAGGGRVRAKRKKGENAKAERGTLVSGDDGAPTVALRDARRENSRRISFEEHLAGRLPFVCRRAPEKSFTRRREARRKG